MSLIKPTITEELFRNFFKLESDRPYYYLAVYRVARNIFMNLDMLEKVDEMNRIITEKLEMPLGSDFQSIIHAFYDLRFINSKNAYTKIGDEIDYVEVTRYDIMRILEEIKDWIYDQVIVLAQFVRFTRPSEIYN